MDEAPPKDLATDGWIEDFAQSLAEEQQRIAGFLAAHRERLDQARADLTQSLESAFDKLRQHEAETAQHRSELDRRAASLEDRAEAVQRQEAALRQLEQELETRQHQWETAQEQARQLQEALAERIEEQHRKLAASQEAWEEKLAQIRQAHGQLEYQRQELAEQRTQTQSQRRRIAEQLKRQRDRQLEEIAQQRLDLERLQTAETRKLQSQIDQLRQQLQEQAAQRDADQQRLVQLAAELEAARTRETELEVRLNSAQEEITQLAEQRQEAERRQEETQRQLDAARQQLDQRAAEADRSAEEESIRQRYEMACQEIRELKSRIQELETQAPTGPSPATASPGTTNSFASWEEEKQRILAALEEEADPEDERAKEERIRTEAIVRKTDSILADKDQEIDELKKLLEHQSSNLGSVAVGAAAIGEILDQDEIIREERQRLQEIQAEWEEKLRQAEVEISVERAKIARSWAEIEEQRRNLQEALPKTKADQGASAQPGKPSRGRWLAQLGLGSEDGS